LKHNVKRNGHRNVVHGFRLSEVEEHHPAPTPVEPAQLLARFTPESEAFTNLFCVKGPPARSAARAGRDVRVVRS
jgi:hypothetical protein